MNNLNIPESNLPRVVIIGCGFAGLNLAQNLKNKAYQVVMLDKHNYHTFQPLLYQVATAGLEPDSIAYPIRNIFKKQKNFFFRMAEAHGVDPKEQTLRTNIGVVDYDYLVIATGSSTNYFGMERVEELAVPMKSVPEALNLRSLILQNFEAASLTENLKERERLMNFVIVGAGPTGTELAGALAELKTHVLPHDYPDLDFRRMSIHLIEMADKVLPPMSKFSSNNALAYLESLGVQVWLNTAVQDYDGETVTTNKKKKLPASTLIWAAGVSGALIDGFEQGQDYQKGRYLVNELSQVGKHEHVFAIGDVAAMVSEKNPKGHPMLAQVAIQQGENLAANFTRELKNQTWQPFTYKDMGTMATVGRNKAVAELYNKINLKGFAGWFVWMMVHLISLVGFRNRLVVLLNWFVNYLSYDRKIRLIIRPVNRETAAEKELSLASNKEALKP
jgi:NADH dehydrogenase